MSDFTLLPQAGTQRYRACSLAKLRTSQYWSRIPRAQQQAINTLSHVLPFRVNEYVLEKLINWEAVPDDPLYRLVFPHSDMLEPEIYERLTATLQSGNSADLNTLVRTIRLGFNPHPAGQVEANIPYFGDDALDGLQHKYRQTVLLFPANGQTCHAYCSFCFRWPQFISDDIHKFRLKSFDTTIQYLSKNRDITDVLITGGDPLIMTTAALCDILRPLLALDHIRTIRIGTKAISFWPYRFLTDSDADDLIDLFHAIVRSGRHLALMAHVNHPREIETEEAIRAIVRIRSTGAVLRIQAPLLRHINDRPEIWAQLWLDAVQQGCVPYYMFVARDTGPQAYFQVPLAKAYSIYRDAAKKVSGLARTARGPSMSCYWGKLLVDGVLEIAQSKYFVLRFLQARDERLVLRPFLAKYRADAYWIDDLFPAVGDMFDLGDGITFDPRVHEKVANIASTSA